MKPRVLYLDVLRCMAILMVLVLHSNASVLVDAEVYRQKVWMLCVVLDPLNRTGVPLFFLISGCLLLRSPGTRELWPFYRHNLSKLLVPLAAWNGIYFWVDHLRSGESMDLKQLLAALGNQGMRFHMWFIYAMLAMYLLCPFLKRMADDCTQGQLLVLLILLLVPCAVAPLIPNGLSAHISLIDWLTMGKLQSNVCYFLLGYWLGTWAVPQGVRWGIYLAGAASYGVCVWAIFSASSSQEICLPFESGTSIFQFLIAAAIFLWCKEVFASHETKKSALAAPMAWLSTRAFGAYWVHILVLERVNGELGAGKASLQGLFLCSTLTVAISFAISGVISYLPGLRRVL